MPWAGGSSGPSREGWSGPWTTATAGPRFRHLRPRLSDTLLKPFAWQGDLCFGPVRDGQPTYQAPESSPRWSGLPEVDDAGRRAVVSYLAGYGPATRDQLHYWLVEGLSAGRRRLDGWLADLLGERVVDVTVGGHPMLHLREHLEGLSAQPPARGVVLLPGYDQWVLGPGTADRQVVPAARRALVTRGANLVLHAGVVAGTWVMARGTVTVSWFSEAASPPRDHVAAEVERLLLLVGHDLELVVTTS